MTNVRKVNKQLTAIAHRADKRTKGGQTVDNKINQKNWLYEYEKSYRRRQINY